LFAYLVSGTIAPPHYPLDAQGSYRSGSNRYSGRGLRRSVDVRFGSEADICSAKRHVRFTPQSGQWNDQERSGSNATARGKITLISVNSLGCVSTSIVPPCCLTTMSWLIDSPSPVPSPAGFVVKNGLKIFSLTSGGMPVPLSRIVISTRSPRFFVAAARVGS